MQPVLLQRWGFTIRSYPAMLYAGLVAGVMAGNAAAHAAGLDTYRVYVATSVLLVPALIGARLFYVVSHWRIYKRNPRRIWNRSEGGFSLYGGLALAFPLSAPVAAALQLS
jgi:phosphatidylglycerol---prolipoprotein diacylglyceryl transferase